MYDRIPTPGQEGRMLISPEGGTPYYATVAMADNPTQEGTFINKATLLKDATAALFGFGANAVPDDVHNWVGQYAKHWWSVLHGQAGTGYKEKRTDIAVSLAITSARGTTLSVSKSINIDQGTGAISLASPTDFTVPSYLDTSSEIEPYLAELASMAPIYIFGADEDKETVFYLPEGTTYSPHSTSSRYTIYGSSTDDHYFIVMNSGATVSAQKITSQLYNIPAGATTYVNSTDRNAYPDDATEGNLTYRYLGIPFDNAAKAPQIFVGSYVGTGQYGSANANIVYTPFTPDWLIVVAGNTAQAMSGNVFVRGQGVSGGIGYSQTRPASTIRWGEKSVSWYDTSAVNQLNTSTVTYWVVAGGRGG